MVWCLGSLLLAGCGARVQREPVPYQFRQSLINEESDPLLARSAQPRRRKARRKRARRPKPLAARLRRCRRLQGRAISGTPRRAARRLARRCLGRKVSTRILKGQGAELRSRQASPGDLVLFHNTIDRDGNGKADDRYTTAGVVLGRAAHQVSFIYLRQGHARLGTLSLNQPNRRRLPGSTKPSNSYIRTIKPADPKNTRYLAGQLLAGFITPPH